MAYLFDLALERDVLYAALVRPGEIERELVFKSVGEKVQW